MEPVKQVDGILRAFRQAWKENPLLELMLVGKPDQLVLRESAQTGLVGKAIFFAGEVQYGEVARELQRSHAMILFSKMENMPCVIVEALCSGIPVIATSVGGIPEVISADNGILLAPGDELALRQAILSLVELYGRFDRQAIAQQAALQFSYPTIGKQLDDVYTVCLAEATLRLQPTFQPSTDHAQNPSSHQG
jgi:glycosyltransferase involved in cell wall biosynthesis